MLGYDPTRVEVLLYQFVHLTRGGESSKASKRAGNVVFLDDVMDEIGVDAARWYLVNRGPDQTIEIDLDLAAEKSQKNPVYYVQYAHARIAAILRNADGAEVGGAPPGPLAAEEKELIKRLDRLPGTVREAADRRGPQLLPAYAIRLADDFHRFYHECRVLGDPAAVVPARPLPRDAAGDRPQPRPRRRRGSRADVTTSASPGRGTAERRRSSSGGSPAGAPAPAAIHDADWKWVPERPHDAGDSRPQSA